MSSEIVLKIGGSAYGWWDRVDISWSMTELAQSFALALFDPTEAINPPAFTACTLELDGKLLLSGLIDRVEDAIGERSTTRIRGRSQSAALIDCSTSISLQQMTLKQICTQVCSPFGLTVSGADGSQVDKFALQSESPFAALAQLASSQGYTLYSTPEGAINIAQASSEQLGLIIADGDYLRLVHSRNYQARYSSYSVSSDHVWDGVRSRTVIDNDVPIHRPYQLIADRALSPADCEARAQRELALRRAQALNIQLDMQGWAHAKGDFWRPNTLVRLQSARRNIDQVLLVKSVRYRLDDRGQRTSLSLMPPEALA